MATAEIIPYEKQSDTQSSRSCGAACLSMVYRSLGKEVAQAEIWPEIAKENAFGSVASTTHLMARDALNRGFAAVAFQARHPLQALRLCCESGTRAVLNHRPTPGSPSGHYSVLVDMDERAVVLHDPLYGPARRVLHTDLLELWKSGFPNSEISGYVLIAIAAESPTSTSCWLCRAPVPLTTGCPRCKQPVGLQPSTPLGCIDTSCIARMWNYLCCPSCDYGFIVGAQAPPGSSVLSNPSGADSPGAQPTKAPQNNPLDLSRVFAEIDKFCAVLLAVPGAAERADLRKQIDFMAASKDRLKLAQAEALAHQKAQLDQLASLAQAAKQNQEAHRQKMEELNRPLPPLDPDALGRALLKNLGFTE